MSIDVGAHLRAVRSMYGLSQRELAKRAGVTNGMISLTEQNRVGPSVSSLKRVLQERYAPGADTGADMLSHKGEEGGIVVRGRIELTVGAASRVLGPGDAYYFSSAVPHRCRNAGREECEIISASSPPTF